MSQIHILLLTHLKTHKCARIILGVVIPCSNAAFFSCCVLYFLSDRVSREHPLKCVQWPVLLGGALGRMFGGSSNFLLTFDS